MRQTQNASKKDNRKSILVIGLLLLLVAVIGFGGYTLSKYVTKKSAQDNNAQVAKWGFTVTADDSKAFSDKYANGTVSTETDASKLTVKATTKTVAPGTQGSLKFTIAGSAEVRAKVAVNVADGYTDVVLNYTVGEDTTVKTYDPLKWTLKKDDVVVEGCEDLTFAKLVEKLNGMTETLNPGVETSLKGVYTIEWAWAFENAANPDTNALDTLLAMHSNNNTITANGDYKVAANTSVKLSFNLSISIEQVNTVA